jgi:hypothetical protein
MNLTGTVGKSTLCRPALSNRAGKAFQTLARLKGRQIAREPKPAYQLTLRTPLYAVRNEKTLKRIAADMARFLRRMP